MDLERPRLGTFSASAALQEKKNDEMLFFPPFKTILKLLTSTSLSAGGEVWMIISAAMQGANGKLAAKESFHLLAL